MIVERRLQELFAGDFDLYIRFYNSDNRYAIKYGYDTLIDLWNVNPQVEFLK